ncbi:MAG: hypothetical protein F6K42_12100 [Leptolyngbya sp. SIO1D8]|nr:hypothetical protein [Leptolyngbya sp. SIO1D8]
MPEENSNTVALSSTLPARGFGISPLIRVTLVLLYVSLMLPLPALAKVTQAPVPSWLLSVGIGLGGLVIYGGLSEQVYVDDLGIQVCYPAWVSWLVRRGWRLFWHEITALKPRTTGQGGLVYYFTSDTQQAYLLPMRVAGFAELLRYVETYTQIDTRDVKPLAQPWMYILLLGLSLLLLLVDSWILWTAAHFSGVS